MLLLRPFPLGDCLAEISEDMLTMLDFTFPGQAFKNGVQVVAMPIYGDR